MNTAEPCLLCVEAVADLPVLWAVFQRLDLPAALDRHFPAPLHWKGPLTPGDVLAVWLLFLVSRGDHCLNHVQPWVAQRQGTLSALLGKPVLPTDAHDDRLAACLTRLGTSPSFSALECDLNQQTIRVYQLPTEVVRIDTTTANSYADVLSAQGLLQFGCSQQLGSLDGWQSLRTAINLNPSDHSGKRFCTIRLRASCAAPPVLKANELFFERE